MEFYNYLIKKYGYNEVVLLSEISFEGYSLPWIKKAVGGLCKEEKLIRFDRGVYYIPTQTILGKSKLDPRKVVSKKYIESGNDIFGYFSGTTFMNMLGLSTQMPNTMEVYTNNEVSRVREIPVGSLNVTLRRSRTTVSRENVATMSFLELMNGTDAKFYDKEKRKKVIDFIKENGVTRQTISKYAPYFPDKAMRTMVESEVVYDIAP